MALLAIFSPVVFSFLLGQDIHEMLLSGLFAADYITALDGYSSIPGGWINRHYIQLGYQLAGCAAILSYSFVVTATLLFVMGKISGLWLRLSEEEEEQGLDLLEIGEAIFEHGMSEVLEAGAQKLHADRVQGHSPDSDSAAKLEA